MMTWHAGIPDSGWVILIPLILGGVLAVLHTLAIVLRNEKLVHQRKIEVVELQTKYINDLRMLYGITEVGDVDVLDDDEVIEVDPVETVETGELVTEAAAEEDVEIPSESDPAAKAAA